VENLDVVLGEHVYSRSDVFSCRFEHRLSGFQPVDLRLRLWTPNTLLGQSGNIPSSVEDVRLVLQPYRRESQSVLNNLPPTLLSLGLSISQSASFKRFARLQALELKGSFLNDSDFSSDFDDLLQKLPASLVVLSIRVWQPSYQRAVACVDAMRRYLLAERLLQPHLKWLSLDLGNIAWFPNLYGSAAIEGGAAQEAGRGLMAACHERGITLRSHVALTWREILAIA
jgi:hypothetical protein